jgi:SAM-dependent methyltransferase
VSGDYRPDYYDLFHDDHGGDVFFYRRLALECGGDVLELGAGTGRIVLPIARAGVTVWALELDQGMLATLRLRLEDESAAVRGRVKLHEGDMADFDLGRRFSLVQIPYRAFLHNRFRNQQLSCLRACLRHLEPGGLLAFNVFHPSLEEMSRSYGANAGRWRWVDERPWSDGGTVLLSEAVLFDPAAQLVTSRLRYDRFDADGRLVCSDLEKLDLAYLYPGDLLALLSEVGFTEVRIDGDFDGRPFTADGQELVVRARRLR